MSVVACPKCREEVSVPPRAPREAIVRCPLCYETYALGDALASLPPLLEIIELPAMAGGFSDEPYSDERATRQPRYAQAGTPAAAYDRAAFARELTEDEEDQSDLKYEGGESLGNGDMFGNTESDTATEEAEADAEPTRMPVGRTPVKRQPLHPPGSRKKRKQGNPIGSIIAIVLGGAMAIPSALLLLLWLPSGLHKDPFGMAPWLCEHYPGIAGYIVPEHLKSKGGAEKKPIATGSQNKIDTSSGKQIASNNTKPTETSKAPDETSTLNLGNKFDDALKGDKPDPEMKPEEGVKPELPDFSAIPEPKPEPKTDPPAEENDALAKALAAFNTIDSEFDTVMAGSDKEAKKAVGNAWYQSLAMLPNSLPADSAPVDEVFDKLAESPSKTRIISLLAINTMKAENRTHDGIILSGTVKTCRKGADNLAEITIEIAPGKPVIMVIGSELAEGSKVLIAGKIVDEPAKLLSDYASSEPRAVHMLLVREIK